MPFPMPPESGFFRSLLASACAYLNRLCRIFGHRKILRMEFFQLHHPLNATVLCDRKGCEQVADYLEVDDHGHEYRLCAMHTDSQWPFPRAVSTMAGTSSVSLRPRSIA